jgi:hypothetical protein
MANKPNGTVLDIRGRDAEQAELAIEFEKATCRWRILGDAAEVHLSEQQSKILAALRQEGEPLGAADLEKITEIKRDTLGKAHERVRVRAGSISFFDPLSCGIGIRAWVRSGTSRKSVVLSGGVGYCFVYPTWTAQKRHCRLRLLALAHLGVLSPQLTFALAAHRFLHSWVICGDPAADHNMGRCPSC